ncbi:peptide chain release factor N(5)-glutamine methyltransferase [Thermoflavifilum thermophilum]|uniref:peptide chain release factor N(5)-glutamine methyltransferase n=1 Tax=Thermoflavifilum thermophilum TaxID=1393122 RepID=A0A1I7NHV6_9BACT|nr:peptide chain release factor N(5)-glutamine methyltransferase [Thermoflavifilum thermophilum]SFV34242.1 release factor glutamine methyltransferase [Thermoflavifilum thermophilum]
MTLREALEEGKQHLINSHHYDMREARIVCEWLMEALVGWNKTQQLLHDNYALSASQEQQWNQWLQRAEQGEPVQYILGKAWFCGMEWKVTPDVLIPRPETEQLVHWVIENHQHDCVSILDIGTGSGCIAISLQQQMPQAKVYALDVDEKALQVARENAIRHQSPVSFIQADILSPSTWKELPETDIIVSNPPYVSMAERKQMPIRVSRYEPARALFVHDQDPLLFYRAIARFIQSRKKPAELYLEIHEERAEEVADLLQAAKFSSIEIRKDWFGKNRMIKAAYFSHP